MVTLSFNADGRVVEPADLFIANVPKSLAVHALQGGAAEKLFRLHQPAVEVAA